MADNKIAPAVGMRVVCRAGSLGTVVAARPDPYGVVSFDVQWDDSHKPVSGYRSNRDDWGPGGTCCPVPTPEPPAAKWVPKVGDRITVSGEVSAGGVDGRFVVLDGHTDEHWINNSIALRPEAAPAAPGSMPTSEYDKLAAKLENSVDLNAKLKAELSDHEEWVRTRGGTDNRGLEMQLGDARGVNDELSAALVAKELELGTMARQVERLTKDLKAARDQLRRRGGL